MSYKIKSILFFILFFIAPVNLFALTYEESKDILTLLEGEKYSQLNNVLNSYFDAYSKDISKEEDVDHALEALNSSPPWMYEKIEKWIKNSPESYLPYLSKALYNYRLGWDYRGQKTIDVTTKKQIDKMTYHFNIAKLNFNKALRIEPSLLHAYAYLVNIAINSKNNTELIGYYKKGLEINPYSHRLHLFYSFSLMPRWGGSLSLLEDFSDMMLELSKENPKLKTLAGVLDTELGDQKFYSGENVKALEHYMKAEEYGGYWYLFSNMGDAYLGLRKFDFALPYYEKLVILRPMYPDAYFKVSQAYMYKGEHDKALDMIQIARELNPSKYDFITMEAQLYFEIGDYENSLDSVKLAKIMKPEDNRLDSFIKIIEMKQRAIK